MSAAPETLQRIAVGSSPSARSRSPPSASRSPPASPAPSPRSSARRSRPASTCAAPSRSRACSSSGSTPRPSASFSRGGRSRARCTAGRPPLDAAGAREIVYDVQFTEQTQSARGPCALRRDRRRRGRGAGHERERRRTAARTSWAATTTCAASTPRGRLRPPQRHERRDRQLPATRPASSTASPWSPRSASAGTRRPRRLPRRQGLDRLSAARPGRSRRCRSWTCSTGASPPSMIRDHIVVVGGHSADAARRALHAGGRRGADARRRGPGERDLDRAERPAAPVGAGRREHPSAGSARHGRAAHPLAPPAGGRRRRDGRGRRRASSRAPSSLFESGTIVDVAAPLLALADRRLRRDRLERAPNAGCATA